MEDVNNVCVAFLVTEEYRITHYKLKDYLAWTCERTRREPATAINGHQYDYDFGFLWIARSAILVLPQTQNIAGGKNIRIREKSIHTAKLSGFKSFRIQSSHFIFRIQNMTKPGCFHFGFVLLCVNGKTNPVLKTFRFISSRTRNNFF